MSFRAYGISQSNPWVKRTLLSTYILGAGVRSICFRSNASVLILKQLQWFSSLYARIRESGFRRAFPRRQYADNDFGITQL